MKRFIAIFCVASVIASFAEGDAVDSGNSFGVLRVDVGTSAEAIIAVPWLEPATGDANIAVTNLIKTADLYPGDQLYYYNTSTKAYQVWELNASKQWVAAVDPSNPSAGQTLTRGNAILLKRPTAEHRSASVYLYGQVAIAAPAAIEMAQGSTNAVAYTLIAPPAVGETDLNTNATWSAVVSGDYIVLPSFSFLVWVPDPNDSNRLKWGLRDGIDEKTHKNKYRFDRSKIAAGQGAWYASSSRAEPAENATRVTWLNAPIAP